MDEVTAQVQAGPSSSSPDLVDTKPMFVSVLGLDQSDIQGDTEFETIGLDSLTATEALHAIQTKYSLEFPSSLFELHTTAKAINQYISSKRPGKSSKPVEETVMDPDKEEDLILHPSRSRWDPARRVLAVPVPWWMSEKETNPCLLADDWSGLPVVGAPLKVIRLPGTHLTTFPTPHVSLFSPLLISVS